MKNLLTKLIHDVFFNFSDILQDNFIIEKVEQIEKFLDFLKAENLNKNLVSRKTTDDELINKHTLSSFLFVKHILLLKKEGGIINNIVDIGSGSGFPAIIMAIFLKNFDCNSEIKISVIDSVQKKIDFLYDVSKLLDLKNLECFWGRIEDFSETNLFKNNCDIVTARALGSIEMTTTLALHFLKINGDFLTIKSFNQELEIKNAFFYLNMKNFKISHLEYREDLGESFIVHIKKLSENNLNKKFNPKKFKNKKIL